MTIQFGIKQIRQMTIQFGIIKQLLTHKFLWKHIESWNSRYLSRIGQLKYLKWETIALCCKTKHGGGDGGGGTCIPSCSSRVWVARERAETQKCAPANLSTSSSSDSCKGKTSNYFIHHRRARRVETKLTESPDSWDISVRGPRIAADYCSPN